MTYPVQTPHKPAILLFRGRGIISAIIRWQTRGSYSHAAILMPDGRIVESWQGAGVRVKTLSDWRGVDVYDVPSMTGDQWEKAIRWARARVGKGYDYWAILRFVSRRMMPENDRWFCSEFVFCALAFADIRLFERIDASAISPGLLAISPLVNLVPREATDSPNGKYPNGSVTPNHKMQASVHGGGIGQISCLDCYGGHFRPCQVCGDSGSVVFVPHEKGGTHD